MPLECERGSPGAYFWRIGQRAGLGACAWLAHETEERTIEIQDIVNGQYQHFRYFDFNDDDAVMIHLINPQKEAK